MVYHDGADLQRAALANGKPLELFSVNKLDIAELCDATYEVGSDKACRCIFVAVVEENRCRTMSARHY